MNDFEVRYNAMERANLIMIQRLLFEIADMKGDDGAAWIDRFRNAVVTEISDLKQSDGTPAAREIVQMAHSVVSNTAKMAKERLAQRRDIERP